MTDFYRNELRRATWTWLEAKACRHFMKPSRHKDRTSGRAAKRKARTVERRDGAREATP